ncbi:MAG: NUDIX hydrolase [Pseudomonadota bacterium]
MQPESTSAPVSEARDSATIMLLRDKPGDGIEVFMVQRHSGADFADAFVFPGGLASQPDFERSLEPFCCGLNDREASRQLGIEHGGLGFWVAAIRECFEESGYLLARDFRGELCQPLQARLAQRFADYRRALAAGEITLQEVCETESLTLLCSAIEYVSFWTTPISLKRRYATRFFVAAVPDGQEGVPDGRETVDARWVCPRDAIDLAIEDGLNLHPPTRENLAWLTTFASVDETMAAAHALDKASINEILPVVSRTEAGVSVTLPDGRVSEL